MNKTQSIILLIILMMCSSRSSFGFEDVRIGPREAEIKGSIKYSVIGRYRAEFGQYSGEIGLDSGTNEIRSVYLKIDAASIKSNCSWCDKIVRSEQLLSVEEFPDIIFRSDDIIQESGRYKVRGVLILHGETRERVFPFNVQQVEDATSGTARLKIQGQWVINRKDFKIIWNPLLDKGGIIVGNHFTVDWGIGLSMPPRHQ